LLGCKSAPPPTPATTSQPQQAQYPPRPAIPPPAFKVFHQSPTTITLVTSLDATDQQIAAVIYQLRDAAHAHTFDTLHIPQKLVDARDPILWFHIYRGAKCASEKYASGPPPCGPSYHAAGEYTLGGFSSRDRDQGDLLHGENQTTPLWNADAPYVAPQPATPPQQ
jgi:hypothetical protein